MSGSYEVMFAKEKGRIMKKLGTNNALEYVDNIMIETMGIYSLKKDEERLKSFKRVLKHNLFMEILEKKDMFNSLSVKSEDYVLVSSTTERNSFLTETITQEEFYKLPTSDVYSERQLYLTKKQFQSFEIQAPKTKKLKSVIK